MSYINNSYFNPMQSGWGGNSVGGNFGLQSYLSGLLGGQGGGMPGMMGGMYGGQGGMQMGMLMALLMAALQQQQQNGGSGDSGNQGFPQGSGANGPQGPSFNAPVRNDNNWNCNGSYVSPQQSSGFSNPFQGGCGCQPHNCSPCESGGQLQQSGSGQPINYTTSGGYKVSINGGSVSYTTPDGKNVLAENGDPHETLNGKGVTQANRGSDDNVNDEWTSQQHTIILGDGTRISMDSSDQNKSNTQWNGTIQKTSIYDGNRDIQVNNNGNQVTSDSTNPWQARSDQRNQTMGSTEYFGQDNNGGYTLSALGTQSANGGGFTPAFKDLGNMGDTGNSYNGGGQSWPQHHHHNNNNNTMEGGDPWTEMWQAMEQFLGMGQYA